jgi:uncharacterized protein YigE (DUF2233 family)
MHTQENGMKYLKIIGLFFVLNMNLIRCLEYNHLRLENPSNSIHICKVDPKKFLLRLSAHLGKAHKTSELCKQLNGICAINGSFFMMSSFEKLERMYQFLDQFGFPFYSVYPSYALKKDNEWQSFSSHTIGAIGWDEQHLILDILQPAWSLKIDNIELPIRSFNNMREYDHGLFNYHIGKYIILPQSCLVFKLKNRQLISVKNRYGIVGIPDNDTYIYCIALSSLTEPISFYKHYCSSVFDIKEKYISQTSAHPNTGIDWKSCKNIIASTPLLINDGKIQSGILTNTSEFYTKRHPRSAIGLLENGSLLLVVVDGRSQDSAGMTLIELAEFMLEQGCHAALNLDGGGSSTLVLGDKVMNIPSGRENNRIKKADKERYILEALVFTSKK